MCDAGCATRELQRARRNAGRIADANAPAHRAPFLTSFQPMNIEITPKKSDGLERLIEVKVSVDTVRDAEDQAARRYATSVRLPGFRPGKAPPAMIKKRFR